MDDELEVQEEVVLEHLPEAVLQDIICIAGWLVEYGRNQGTAFYLLVRLSQPFISHFLSQRCSILFTAPPRHFLPFPLSVLGFLYCSSQRKGEMI